MIVPEVVNSCRPWISETPFQLRAYSVFEFYSRYKTCLTNLSNKNIKFFDMKFKSKKNIKWTMDVPKDNMYLPKAESCKGKCIQQDCDTCKFLPQNQFMLYKEIGWIKTTEKIPCSILEYDSKIHFDGLDYYIIVPYSKEMIPEKSKDWFCSLDPGVRKFQAVYNPEKNEVVNIGDKASSKMYQHLLHLDSTISKFSKNSKVKYKKLKLKILRKIQNLQKELRDKVSRSLCNSFHCIVAPKLTKENDIISRKRKLHTKTVRNMTVLGHSKFIETLKTKASEYKDVVIIDTTEEYTSQTCLKCQCRTKTSKEIYKCSKCSFTCDRDTLGSINILLKSWGFMNPLC